MPNQVTLPEVGDNVEQGTVVTVLVKVGDTVAEGQPVIEIETDKAVVEVPANAAGTVAELNVKEGDTVKVGGVILTLEGDAPASTEPGQVSQPEAEPDVAAVAPDAGKAAAVADAQQQSQQAQAAPAAASQAQAPAATGGSGAKVTLPEVGDNVEQGTVVTVLVKAGDTVAEGQAVIEIETDKAVVEVPANAAGTVAEVNVKEGDTVKVGGVILTLTGGAAPAAAGPSSDFQAPASAEAVGTAQDSQGQGEQPATQNTGAQGTQNPQTYDRQETFDGRPVIHAAPSVRRLAREMGVDLAGVQGSGPAGRISEADLKGGARAQPAASAPASAPAATVQSAPVQTTAPAAQPVNVQTPATPASPVIKLPSFEKWGAIRREDMNGIRKATVRSMSNAWSSVPMVTHFDKADVTRMEEARKAFAPRVEKAGGKLTMTAILLKVVANAVRRNPKFGASLDLENQQVIYKEYVNLGVAVDTPNGLLVPVLKDADRKSITEIVLELNELAAKARDRKLKPDEMSGATFSISNLGGIGGYAFTPIVNPPEVAILGVSRGGMEPVWNKETGTFEPRNMLPLTLSYDHRLIDGADAARFVRQICEMLEDPFLISL
ncbi:dihydrolipoyllysine-residue acetyltransferase [Deinococcus altitudinis]|uniref:dihydrolipoyllysine-residue acetyltransferase n=1 Tax=Deinococcus altitudinis TaxID=468914 RepID=UPI003892C680